VSRTNTVDGLGRLKQVVENGISATTTYSYDALDNLVSVAQPGVLTRTFNYNSLSRLGSAFNPETKTTDDPDPQSGTTLYTYDANGNVAMRTLGTKVTTYTYDELDELTGKGYNDSTPPVTYSYNKGWLTGVSSGNTSYQYTTFDGLGRVTVAQQTLNSTTYPFHYSYNLSDGIQTITYPSGRVVTYAMDSIGRVSAISGQVGSTVTNYTSAISPITYAPQGAVASMTLGNGLIEQNCYNAKLQMTLIRQRTGAAVDCVSGASRDSNDVLHLRFNYPVTTNNGNMANQVATYGTKIFTQTYGYDGVNRVTSVSETGPATGWSRNYTYDAVGNGWMTANSGIAADPFTPTASSVYDSSNHMNGSNAVYVSGNQTQIGGYQFAYDAENRLTSSTINGGTSTYAYDGDGRRVMKQSGGVTTVYVYDLQGQLAAEYTTAGTAPAPACTCGPQKFGTSLSYLLFQATVVM
jgi:YD repeat-containing protein